VPISDASWALTLGAYPVAVGKAEGVVRAFLDFELREAKTRNFRFDQERFLVFALVKSKSLDRDPTDCCLLNVVRNYVR